MAGQSHAADPVETNDPRADSEVPLQFPSRKIIPVMPPDEDAADVAGAPPKQAPIELRDLRRATPAPKVPPQPPIAPAPPVTTPAQHVARPPAVRAIPEPLRAPPRSLAPVPEPAPAAPVVGDFGISEVYARGGLQPVKTGRSRVSVAACVLGLLSIPLALLALLPAVWWKVPATAVGFAGLLLGFSSASEIRRSRGRQTGTPLAAIGIVAGIAGMLLGPLVFVNLGRRLGTESGRKFTEAHLEKMGQALGEYHNAKGAFPPGGILKADAEGKQLRMHGWMTLLLPYLGEEEVYRLIDLNLPFDDPANLPAMERDIPVFFAAGADRAKVGGKFGVTHFAGVGGEVLDAEGGTLPVGIFGPNSDVTRDKVSNLSQTLAAGEISANHPAWGEPENWRAIGKGLNRDIDGFGNADGTGASFLMADGSVRFFSNQTNRDVLIRLSTRAK